MLLLLTLMGCPVDSDDTRLPRSPSPEAGEDSGAPDSTETAGDSEPDDSADSVPSGETGETGEADDPVLLAGVEVEATCGASGPGYDEHQDMASDELNLRLVTVSESMGGPITVRVEDPRPLVLALSGYEGVEWVVEEAVPGTIERILVSSDSPSTLTAPSTAAVEEHFGDAAWESGYIWADRESYLQEAEVEAAAGMPLSSFHGCYDASEFVIRAADAPLDTSGRPDCEAPESWGAWEEPDLDYVAGVCPDTTAESAFCVAIIDQDIVTIGLDSGDTCTMVTDYAEGPVYDGTETVALLGDQVYTCASSPGNVVKVSLVDGSLEHARSWCKGLKGWSSGGALLTNSTQRWADDEVYASTSWEQSWCSADESTGVQTHGWRIATEGDTLYTAELSYGEVSRYDLPTGAELGSLSLEGVTEGTGDLSFIQDGAVIVTLDYRGVLHLNDAATGDALDTVDLPGTPDVRGIDCFDGR